MSARQVLQMSCCCFVDADSAVHQKALPDLRSSPQHSDVHLALPLATDWRACRRPELMGWLRSLTHPHDKPDDVPGRRPRAQDQYGA